MGLQNLLPLPLKDRRARNRDTSPAGFTDMAKSSDASSPLKSVAENLSAILKKCKLRTYRERIESLVPRVERLAQSISAPVPEGEFGEEERRKALKRRLDAVLQSLTPLVHRSEVTWFPDCAESVYTLESVIRDISDAMVDYQTSSRQETTLLNGIHPVTGAKYRFGDGEVCLKGTGVDALQKLKRWSKDEQGHHAFYLYGPAGTGKSTIAQTFAEINFTSGDIGAIFVCSRDSEDRSDLRAIFPTVAFQLFHRYPQFREQLIQVSTVNTNARRESLCSQMERLLIGPLKATRIRTIIIIAALDECRDKAAGSAILSVLSRYASEIPWVKFVLTGRQNPTFISGIRPELPLTVEMFGLHDTGRSSVDRDIKLFLETKLTDIAKTRGDCGPIKIWPTPRDIDALCEKAAGLFVYASTVVKFVAYERRSPATSLGLVISLPRSIQGGKKETSLHELFTLVLEQTPLGVHTNHEEFYNRFRSVVGALLLLFNPLPMEALSNLLGVPDIPTTLHSLRSLILVPTSKADPIQFFHKSFPDFLTDPGECKDKRFFIDPSVHHREILLSCLNLMRGGLKKNICDLDNYTSIGEVEDLPTRRKARIGDVLEYACLFWAKHLIEIPSSGHGTKEVCEAIDEFSVTCLLFWIEALVVIGSLDVTLYAIDNVRRWYASAGSVCEWADDSQRFIMGNLDVIRDTPSEIYHYALSFSPSSSWVRVCYSAKLLQEVEVVKGLPERWGECLYTVPFDHKPQVLACWKELVAVGMESGDIVIVDVITGIRTSVLSGHAQLVGSLAFSSDGTLLVSGSDDKTIALWDIQTGGLETVYSGHTGRIRSVSISPDHSMIASGSDDKTVRLWDTRTGVCFSVIDRHVAAVNSVSFSTHGARLLLSASEDQTVQRWTAESQIDFQLGSHHESHHEGHHEGHHVALSSHGSSYVSWGGGVAEVRNSDSGAVIAKLVTPPGPLRGCCFSPSGKFVAGAMYHTIFIWAIDNDFVRTIDDSPRLIWAHFTYNYPITSLTFSSSLLLSSHGQAIKFWQLDTLLKDSVAAHPESTKPASPSIKFARPAPPPIESISLQASDGITITHDSAGVARIWDTSTGDLRKSIDILAPELERGDAEFLCGKLTFGWFTGKKIHLWDAERGHFQKVDVPQGYRAWDFRVSVKGSKVFLLDHDHIRAWSIDTGEVVGEVKLEDEPLPNSLVVCGSRVWARFKDSPIQGWDFESKASRPLLLSSLFPCPLPRPHLAFIDRTAVWNTDPSRIEDTDSGGEVFRLSGRYGKPTVARWDGSHLVAGYTSGEMLILNWATMKVTICTAQPTN